MNGIELAQDTGLWHAFVNTIVPVRTIQLRKLVGINLSCL